MLRQTVFIILAVLTLGAGGWATKWLIENRPVAEVVAPPAPRRFVRAARLKKRDKTFWVRGFGVVRPKTELSVVPQVSGRVVERAAGFRTGGFVRKGALLFRIDAADYRLEIERRRAEIARLEADLARLGREEENHRADMAIAERHMEVVSEEVRRNGRLRRQGVVSAGQYDQSRQNFLRQERTVQSIRNALALLPVQLRQKRAAIDVSRAALKRALLQLSRTRVTAPFDARVRETSLDVGDFAAAGRPVGVIYDVSALEVPVSLPVEEARWAFPRARGAFFPRGQEEAKRLLPAARVSWSRLGEKFEWEGRVSLVDAGLDASTRALTLVVEVSEPLKNRSPGERPPLFVGMFVRAEIEGVTMSDVFVIPRAALRAGDRVYLLEEGRLRIQKAEVVRKDEEGVVIKSGVKEGDLLILSPVSDPVPGMRLEARGEKAPGVSAR